MVQGHGLAARETPGLRAAESSPGVWITAGNLHAGDVILSRTGPATLLDVRECATAEWACNLEVRGPHTYFVGDHGPVAHNSRGHAAIDTLDEIKQHYILQGKHNWNDVAKDPSSWDEVARATTGVLNNGTESVYKTVHQKTLNANGKNLVVTYTRNAAGTVCVSDGRVEP